MKKIFALLISAAMVLSFAACTGGDATPPPSDGGGGVAAPQNPETPATPAPEGASKIGISMPTRSLQRWNQDGDNMKQKFEAAGYVVDLQYAGDNDIPTQISQIENMITTGCKVIVIAAIDGESLTTVLAQAAAADIPVIAYDRLIKGTDAVTYYATFDNYKVGQFQGKFLEEKLGLASGAGPFNIELIGGDPGDNNALVFFQGAMDVLQKYIDSGKLVVVSGQTEFDQIATAGWSSENAQTRFENILTAHYSAGKKLDAVMASNDSTAQGVAQALVASGITAGPNYPLITGQDCDVTSVKNMATGLQAMSIFKDTRTLAERTVTMVDSILKGGTPEINNTTDYDNGVKVVPSYLCEPVSATLDGLKELLFDSGYYKAAEFDGYEIPGL